MNYLLCAALASCLVTGSALANNTTSQTLSESDEILFKLKSGASPDQLPGPSTRSTTNHSGTASDVAASHGLSIIKQIGKGNATAAATSSSQARVTTGGTNLGIFKARVRPGQTPESLAEILAKDPRVAWAEPNDLLEAHRTLPGDSDIHHAEPYLNSTNISQIWDHQQGSESVTVAIIDSGVDYTHPDLQNNIWHNPGEIPGDGIDNDGNGFVDDDRGWDFVSVSASAVHATEDPGPPDNDPMDVDGHGTHVAGIVAAEGNNGTGIAGVSWHSRIMALRAGYRTEQGRAIFQVSDVAEALLYACDNGADVVNMSLGGIRPPRTIEEAVAHCYTQDVLLVASAGNNGLESPGYPAGFTRVLAVAASDHANTTLADFSNYGIGVDIAAPGQDIYSTLPGGVYGAMSGTSMASPLVAGMAALIKSESPGLKPSEVTALLKNMATLQEGTQPGVAGAGYARLDWPLDLSSMTPRAGIVALSVYEDAAQTNQSFQPGEDLIIRPTIENYTATDQGIQVHVTTDSAYLQIATNELDFGSIPPYIKQTSPENTLGAKVLEGVPENHLAALNIELRSGTTMLGSSRHTIMLNPTLKTLNHGSPTHEQAGYVHSELLEHPDGRISHFYRSQADTVTGKNTLYHRVRDLQGGWTEAVPIPPASEDDTGVKLHAPIIHNGEAHVFFLENRDLQHASQVNGEWVSQVILENPASVQDLVTGSDAESNLYVAWRYFLIEQSTTAREAIRMISLSDGDWSPVRTVVELSNEKPYGPYHLIIGNLASFQDKNGDAQLIWRQSSLNESGSHLMQAKLKPEGEFAPVAAMEGSSLHSVANDVNGNVHVAYDSGEQTYHRVFDGNSWSTKHDLYPAGNGILTAKMSGAVEYVFHNNNPETIMAMTFQNNTWSIPELLRDLKADESFHSEIFGDAIRTSSDELLLSLSTAGLGARIYLIDLYSSSDYLSQVPESLVPLDEGAITGSPDIKASVDGALREALKRSQFAVGSAPGKSDLMPWSYIQDGETSLAIPAWTRRNDLKHGQTYYVSTRGFNHAGYPPGMASSDGITYLTGESDVHITSPADGEVLTSSSQTFEWATVPGANAYRLKVGSDGQGTSDIAEEYIYNSGLTSHTFWDLPNDGRTLYVSLEALNTTEHMELGSAHATYTAFSLPTLAMVSPADGATFTSQVVEFIWNEVPGASTYIIQAGLEPGGNEIANEIRQPGTTSVTIDDMPTNGESIHVTLSTFAGNNWITENYTYTAHTSQTSPDMTSPQDGSTLTSDTVEFQWNEIPGTTGQIIRVGSTQGSDDIAVEIVEAGTLSAVVDSLPVDGRTIYVSLNIFSNGQWRTGSFTYTAHTQPAAPSLNIDFQSNWYRSTTTLYWEGADAVDIYRESEKVASNTTDNPYTDTRWFNSTRYNWKVCLPDTQVCSETEQ